MQGGTLELTIQLGGGQTVTWKTDGDDLTRWEIVPESALLQLYDSKDRTIAMYLPSVWLFFTVKYD